MRASFAQTRGRARIPDKLAGENKCNCLSGCGQAMAFGVLPMVWNIGSNLEYPQDTLVRGLTSQDAELPGGILY
jgi:hypothetical protein